MGTFGGPGEPAIGRSALNPFGGSSLARVSPASSPSELCVAVVESPAPHAISVRAEKSMAIAERAFTNPVGWPVFRP